MSSFFITYCIISFAACTALFLLYHALSKVACLLYDHRLKRIGDSGEEHIGDILSQLSEEEYQTLNDVVLKTTHGTTQIDHIVVSRYGVFVIETKNYRGQIYGDDDRYEWKQIIKTDVNYSRNLWKTYTYITKNEMYNPVSQCIGHMNQVHRCLSLISPHIKIIPIVVFSDEADLAKVTSSIDVINSCQLLDTIRSYKTPCCTDSEIIQIYDLLVKLNVRDEIDSKQHTKNVQRAKFYTEEKIRSGICPRCGKELILCKGRYNDFYRCSGYPTCRFTVEIDS